MAVKKMTKRQERIQHALEELKGMIRAVYPQAQFEISRGHEDPRQIHLLAIVDIENLDAIKDITIDREVDMQLDEHLPIHVIPLWPQERSHDELRKRQRGEPNWIDGDSR